MRDVVRYSVLSNDGMTVCHLTKLNRFVNDVVRYSAELLRPGVIWVGLSDRSGTSSGTEYLKTNFTNLRQTLLT